MNLLNAYLRSPRVQRALNKKTKNSGFTLIELVIVVAILAILAAIGIPAFSDAQTKARTAAAQTMLATIYKECSVSALLDDTASYKAISKLEKKGGVTYSSTKNVGVCVDAVIKAIPDGGTAHTINIDTGAKTPDGW